MVDIEQGTGKVTPKNRLEDFDAQLSKVVEDPKLGVWRGPFVYAYFDTRVVRRANALHADLGNQPYGLSFQFMEYALLPESAAKKALAGGSKKNLSVEAEKKALEEAGTYYAE